MRLCSVNGEKKPEGGGHWEMQAGRLCYRGKLSFATFDDFC